MSMSDLIPVAIVFVVFIALLSGFAYWTRRQHYRGFLERHDRVQADIKRGCRMH